MSTKLFTFFLVVLFSLSVFSQNTGDKSGATIDGVALGMTKDQVKAALVSPRSEGYDEDVWLYDSLKISVQFNKDGVVVEVLSDDSTSILRINGKEIAVNSDINKAFEILGKHDEEYKTENVSEYYFKKLGIMLLTFADDNAIALLALKTY
ncbi:MAG: hypothetical protein IPJ75_01010 [Ignavibacteriales bacterium]|nr:hypothetical protein [Ignavibacteriales bacterium]